MTLTPDMLADAPQQLRVWLGNTLSGKDNAHLFALIPSASPKGYERHDCKDWQDALSYVRQPLKGGGFADRPGSHIELCVIDKVTLREFSLFIEPGDVRTLATAAAVNTKRLALQEAAKAQRGTV